MGKNKSKSRNKIKKKKHKKRCSSSSSDDSTDSGNEKLEWVEAPALETSKRDSWMNEELFIPSVSKEIMLSSSKSQKQQKREHELEISKQIQEKRELNPYWKNDGKGIPENDATVDSLHLPTTSVGDGGYSWLKKAYQRIEEQSKVEGRPMEELAVERWGSLDKLVSLLNEAKARRERQQDLRSFQDPKYRSRAYNSQDWKKDPGSSIQLRKPSNNDEELRNSIDSERSVEFRKPVRSKRKNPHYFSSASQKHERDDSRNKSDGHSRELESEDSKNEKSDSQYEKHLPSWKKPNSGMKPDAQSKNVIERNTSVVTPPVSSNSRKETEAGPGYVTLHPSDKSESSPHVDPITQLMMEGDLTKLCPKYLKAELGGDMALATRLKNRIDEIRASSDVNSKTKPRVKQETVHLMKEDNRGQMRPLSVTQEEDYANSHSKQKQGHGRKQKTFADSKYSLKQMFEKEKSITSDDHIQAFFEVASKSKTPSDLDYDMDDVSRTVSEKMSHGHLEERDIKKAIHNHQRLQSALDRCQYCLDQPSSKHLNIIYTDNKVYLCLPNYVSMVDGHCLIVPKSHVSSFLGLDEDEWEEVESLKKTLIMFFEMQDKCATFLETSMNFSRHPHAVMECIPMPKETGELAPIYFKKAIQESEEEWAQNKKLVKLSLKGVRYSIPSKFPYFCVNFDPKIHYGFAHVIEDERCFPRNFGKEVIGGMLDIDYNHLYKNKKTDPSKKLKEMLAFQEQWKSFTS